MSPNMLFIANYFILIHNTFGRLNNATNIASVTVPCKESESAIKRRIQTVLYGTNLAVVITDTTTHFSDLKPFSEWISTDQFHDGWVVHMV